ncbi:hypothetical protein JCM9279_004030 [Rhodotorula babjevae]
MDHTAQGGAPQASSPTGPDHPPEHAHHDPARFYLPALADPTHPHPPNHHLVPPHPAQDGTRDGFRANSGDDDVDALMASALAAYTAGAARNHGADQLALVRAAANAVGIQQQRHDERQHGHAAGQHGPGGGADGGDDHDQGVYLPQLPVPPPSFANVHPAPAPAALPSPPSTSTSSVVAAASTLASSSSAGTAAAPPTSAAPLPSSTSSAPSSAPAAPTSSRGRGPGSRARWSAPEDARLVHLVRVVPPLTWNEIGAEMGRAPTGCSMRWYKFLRERVARGEMGPGTAPTGAAGGAQGLGALEPSSEMVVGGSAGATLQAQAHGGAVGAAEGSLEVVHSSGTASSTSPSSALANGTAKARPLRKPTSSALATGRPAAHVAPIEPSALPPPLPPSETLPGHPYPLKKGTKLHSNAGKGYLPRDAMVAKPPVPFQPHTVLRGRRTQKAVPLPVPDAQAAAATAAGSAAESAPASASPADLALPLPPPFGAAASAASPSSTLSSAPSLELNAAPSTSTAAEPTAPSSAPAPTSLSPSLASAAPAAPSAPGAPPKKGKGSKGGLSKAQASVHACPAEHCTAAFKRSEHLRRHYKSVHRGEKPFPCTVAGCGKTFSRKDNLQQHQAMVHLVRARYTYPDGSSSNDPPEAGTDAARLVVISFDEVDVARSTKAGAASASGADQEGGTAAGAGAKAKKKRQKKGERTPAVVAQAQGQAQALPSAQGADAQGWRAVVPGAAQYSVAPSTSPSVEPGEGDDAQRPSSSSAKRPRERSAGATSASAPGSRLDGNDAHDDGRIDKRLRLTGLAGQDDDALDPALQVLAAQAQAQAHAHAHAHGHSRGARSITPSAAFALSGTHALAHAPILGSTSSGSSSAAAAAAAGSAAEATQEFYARIAHQLEGGRRSSGGDGRADMLVHGGLDGASTGAGARAGQGGGLAGMYVPGLEEFLDGQLGPAQGLGGEAGGQGGGQLGRAREG